MGTPGMPQRLRILGPSGTRRPLSGDFALIISRPNLANAQNTSLRNEKMEKALARVAQWG